jgi:hypothetical protein
VTPSVGSAATEVPGPRPTDILGIAGPIGMTPAPTYPWRTHARTLALLLVLALGLAFAQPSGTLRLYTSQPDADAAITKAAFEAAHPGVRRRGLPLRHRAGDRPLPARGRGRRPQADVLLVADAPTFELLKARDLLEPYRSISAAAIGPATPTPTATTTAPRSSRR